MRVLLLMLVMVLAPLGTARAVQPSLVMHKLTVDIDVRPDGTATVTQHREISPASLAAAAQIGQYAIGFNPSLQRLDILQASTAKQDGTRLPVDMSQIRTQLIPGAPNSPVYQDMQQKVVVFPDLAAGDTEDITWREETHTPLFAGQFMWNIDFSRFVSWEDVVVTIRAPASYPLHTETFGVDFSRSEQDGVVSYVWRYRATDVVAEDVASVSDWDRLPRFFVSSFPDYGAMAAAYAKLADPKVVVTPRIQERADAITAGIEDRRAQARAIYEWVSTHIRYVALYLGPGGVEPHEADAALANGYGDCKDHTVLFEALLRAKGIAAHTVLINLGSAYTLSGPPTMAQLNHAISYLPEFDVYADTTSGVAPFGTLPFQEYGKPAVIVGMEGEAIRRMPALARGIATIETRTQAQMQLDGAIMGTTTTSATGPAAIALRLTARWVQTAGHEAAARRQLVALGEQGTGVFSFPPPDSFGASFTVTGTFKLDPQPEILDGDSFAPPLGLQLLVRAGDYLLGPLNRTTLPESEPTPCWSGRQVEDLALEVPEGRLPQRLPKDRRIETPSFTYSSSWSTEGQVVRVRRELVTTIDQPLCAGTLRREAAAALAEIRRDQRSKVVLATP
jgi:transglutaminase-like putative cysteine protease